MYKCKPRVGYLIGTRIEILIHAEQPTVITQTLTTSGSDESVAIPDGALAFDASAFDGCPCRDDILARYADRIMDAEKLLKRKPEGRKLF